MTDSKFLLDERLVADTEMVADLALCRVLLMNESRYPWLILVPRRGGLREILDLTAGDRALLYAESECVSGVLQSVFTPHKLNIAALGNVVEQLHVHHIARFTHDEAWPAPVWGKFTPTPYPQDELNLRVDAIKQALRREVARS